MFLFLLGAAIGVLGQTGPSRKIIEAESFIVRDSSGKVRGELGTTDRGGAKLELGTADGRRVAHLGGDGNLALFMLYGDTGSWTLSLAPPPLGNQLALLDSDHNVRLGLGSTQLGSVNGAAGLDLWDASKRVRGRLLVSPGGDALLGFYDNAGQMRLSLDLSPTDVSRLRFLDATGHAPVGLVSQKRVSGMILDGSGGKASLLIDSAGSPGIQFTGKDGHVTWRAP